MPQSLPAILAHLVNIECPAVPGDILPARYFQLALAVVAILFAERGLADADARGVFRVGIEPLALDPSDDTPFLTGRVSQAVTAYNAASAAYNRLHGYAAGSRMASAPIDRRALGLHTNLVTFAPGFEVGGKHVMFRIEGLVSVSDRVRAVGAGVYPLDLAAPLRHGTITPYLVAGGTVRWLDRSNTEGEAGGLVTLRIATGARIGGHFIVELGVGVFMLGGLYNHAELRSMLRYDPRGNAPLPAPDVAFAGGEQSGMIDVSVGWAL
jgi:hypothetical protein